MFNPSTVRPMPRLPLPRGSAHDSWVIDMIKPELVSQTWTLETAPYFYTSAGAWVRKAMPARGVIRASRLLDVLADYAERMRGELHDEFKVPRETSARAVADLIVATVLVEDNTSFAVVLVEPTGRVWFRYQLNDDVWAWHPDAPRERTR